MAERALLMLADIAGYTEFMRLHRLNLAHSQEITQRLLEAMLDAVPALTLVEVEGDALFLSAPQGAQEDSSDWLQAAVAMYGAFHTQQQWMLAHNVCGCDACRQIGRLHVKFVAHAGEVVSQRIRGSEKLVGVDVITVHRMLKNAVPVAEYVLMSEPLYLRLEPRLRERATRVEQELEGLGEVPLYFVGFDGLPIELPAVPEPTLPARLRETIGFGLRAFPRLLGGGRAANRPR